GCYHGREMSSGLNVFGEDRTGLERVLLPLGEPAYRVGQLYSWLYRRRARSVAEMTDLPHALRERLASGHELLWPEVGERRQSRDGTVKYLFRLPDGTTIESVFIPEE